MKAVMYGAGNIGRGFIAKRFFLSGAHTTFIDVNADLVAGIAAAGRYPIYVTKGREYVPEWVENVTAVNGRDSDAVVEQIAECDILATALGVNILPFVAENLARGIAARYARGARPLNILICENLIGSGDYLRGLVAPHISADLTDYFENSIGFVSVSVGITVPPTPQRFLDENPLAVCTDLYSELPADATGFRPVGAPFPVIDNLRPFSPFDFYIQRKLLIHNMGHATMAYLGYLKGYGFIYEVAEDEKIDAILRRALNESASALAARHGVPESELADFVEHLIPRLYNPLLEDSIFRVGRDTRRKLSAGDRLGGAYIAVREQGKTPAAIGLSIAAALRFDMPEDEIGVEVSTFAKENGVAAALEKYCSITADEDVALIKGYYDMLATPDWDALIAKIDENKKA